VLICSSCSGPSGSPRSASTRSRAPRASLRRPCLRPFLKPAVLAELDEILDDHRLQVRLFHGPHHLFVPFAHGRGADTRHEVRIQFRGRASRWVGATASGVSVVPAGKRPGATAPTSAATTSGWARARPRKARSDLGMRARCQVQGWWTSSLNGVENRNERCRVCVDGGGRRCGGTARPNCGCSAIRACHQHRQEGSAPRAVGRWCGRRRQRRPRPISHPLDLSRGDGGLASEGAKGL
jgi:hypothetical protein